MTFTYRKNGDIQTREVYAMCDAEQGCTKEGIRQFHDGLVDAHYCEVHFRRLQKLRRSNAVVDEYGKANQLRVKMLAKWRHLVVLQAYGR